MSVHTITAKYEGRCADCGAMLPVGAKARYYGRGIMYGITCMGTAISELTRSRNRSKPLRQRARARGKRNG